MFIRNIILIIFMVTLMPLACSETKGRPPVGINIAEPIDIVFPNASTMLVANANNTQSNFFDASLMIFNISNPVFPFVQGAIPTPLFNGRMAMDPVLPNTLFMTNRLSEDDEDFVDQIFQYNTSNANFPVFQRTIFTGDDPFGIDIVPAGNFPGFVLTSHISDGTVSFFDGGIINSVPEFIPLGISFHNGSFSSEIAVSPDGALAVVTNTAYNILYILDLTPPDAFTVEAAIMITQFGLPMADYREALWLDNRNFVVANRTLNGVFFVNLDQVINGLPLVDDANTDEFFFEGTQNLGISSVYLTYLGGATSLALLGTRLFVSEFWVGSITEIDSATHIPGAFFPSGGEGPVAIRIEPSGRYLYAANQSSNQIGIIDLNQNRLVGSLP